VKGWTWYFDSVVGRRAIFTVDSSARANEKYRMSLGSWGVFNASKQRGEGFYKEEEADEEEEEDFSRGMVASSPSSHSATGAYLGELNFDFPFPLEKKI
jgi:hypothetical protein